MKDALRSYLIVLEPFEVLSFLVSDALQPSCSTTLQLCFNRHAFYPSSQLHENGKILKQSGRGRIL